MMKLAPAIPAQNGDRMVCLILFDQIEVPISFEIGFANQ
jgi:hypothetical protein